jgi:hypothetical protein
MNSDGTSSEVNRVHRRGTGLLHAVALRIVDAVDAGSALDFTLRIVLVSVSQRVAKQIASLRFVGKRARYW